MGNQNSVCSEDDPILTAPINEDEFHIRLSHESIKDTYTLRKLLDARTNHGSVKISLRLAPLSTPQRTISTSTNHGTTHVDFTSSLAASASHLTSLHESYSSNVTLDYPDDWRGTIEITTSHGSYEFNTPADYDEEDRVRILRDVRVKGYRTVTAVKGRGVVAWGENQSVLRVKTSHGSVKVNFERKKVEGPGLLPVAEGIPAGVSAEEVRRVIPDLPGGGRGPTAAGSVGGGISKAAAAGVQDIVPPAHAAVQPPPYEESEATHAVTADGTSTMSSAPNSPTQAVAPQRPSS